MPAPRRASEVSAAADSRMARRARAAKARMRAESRSCPANDEFPLSLPQSVKPSPRVVEPVQTESDNIPFRPDRRETFRFAGDFLKPKRGLEPLTCRVQGGGVERSAAASSNGFSPSVACPAECPPESTST